MKIMVAVKRVIDPYVKIRVKSDGTGVETQQVKMAMNPFDEIALEAAMQFRESGLATEVIVVSIGQESSQETLRQALAFGADRAIFAKTDNTLEPLSVAKILKHIAETEQIDLILMGKQSIDGDNNQTPQMLSALLDWPQATYASNIAIEGGSATVTREIDGGLETIAVTTPAVVSVDLRLNKPRYPSLPNIMKAKQKPLASINVQDMPLNLKTHQTILKVEEPKVRQGGVKVDSVSQLVEKLRHEAKVIA